MMNADARMGQDAERDAMLRRVCGATGDEFAAYARVRCGVCDYDRIIGKGTCAWCGAQGKARMR